MQGTPHLAQQHQLLEAQVAEQTAKLRDLRKERSENEAVLEGLRRRIELRRARRPDDARAHIRHPMEPVSAAAMRFNRAVELWAAISISLLLVGLAAFVLFAPEQIWASVIVLVLAFVLGESILRGRFARTVNQVAVILALISVVVLFVHFVKHAVVVLLVGLAVFLVYQRIRELRA